MRKPRSGYATRKDPQRTYRVSYTTGITEDLVLTQAELRIRIHSKVTNKIINGFIAIG